MLCAAAGGCSGAGTHATDGPGAADAGEVHAMGQGGSDAGAAAGSGGADAGAGAGTAGGGGAGGAAGSRDGGTTPVGPIACAGAPAAPAPASQWINATGNLAGMAAGCTGLSYVAAQPCSKRVIAGVEGHGLWASDDSGKTWQALGAGGGSAVITNAVGHIVFDPAHPEIFWEAGIRGTAGLYQTRDDGLTFKQLGTMTFTQQVSVDFGDPARATLLTGTHGMKQLVFRSPDGGGTWTNVGLNLPATAHNGETPLVIDAHTYLLGACGQGDGVCGVYRSTDSGATWTLSNDVPVSHFGAPLWASDGAIYWPLLSDGGLSKSTDLGKTWTKVVGPGTLVGLTPLELPDRTIVTVGIDHVMRSSDGGKSWQPILDPLPFRLAGGDTGSLTYSAATRTFFLSHFDCGASKVLADAVMSAGFDSSAP